MMARSIKDIGWGKYLPYIIGFFALIVAISLYRRFFSAAAEAKTAYDEGVAKKSSEIMENGMTYMQFADELLNHLWSFWSIIPGLLYYQSFSLKNTDEKAIGNLLLTCKRDEFPLVSSVYSQLKATKGMSDNSPLMEDLTRTFNSREQGLYLSHLR